MQHLDEGTIHAWLDGQLPRDEAAAVEVHVAECRECADAVAEARGLIAASSRILLALDGVPREVAPKREQPSAVGQEPLAISHQPSAVSSTAGAAGSSAAAMPATVRARRRWFSAPSLAAAATIVVAVGTLTIVRARDDESARSPFESAVVSDRASAPSTDTATATASMPVRPSAPPAPAISEAPTATPEARVGAAAGQSRTSADRVARADGRREADAARAEETPLAAAAPSTSAARAPGAPGGAATPTPARDELARGVPRLSRSDVAEGQQRQRAANEPREELAKVPVQTAATPAPPRPDTARVQVFRGTKAESPRITSDTARANFAAKAVADAAATTGSVRGRVTDANKTGIESAHVQVAGTAIGVTTSQTGDFELRGVPAGTQRITARRIGFEVQTIGLIVAAGETASADFTLVPSRVSLENVVVTGTGGADRERRSAPAAPAPARSAQSATAYGCYDLGITPATSQPRSDFGRIPRRIALDSVVVPGRSDGVWYRVRDLTRTGTAGDGIWRPTSADAIEAQWTSGTRTATVRLTGVPGPMLRGTADEIDSAAAIGSSATVVAAKMPRCPGS
jgi:hypothetical protein